jgi:hypothetical protein
VIRTGIILILLGLFILGCCSVILVCAPFLWLATNAKNPQAGTTSEGVRRYKCPECCDTGCVFDPNLVATATTEGDVLADCSHCSPWLAK